jgi:6-phosphogluconolactonase (cycloisomerase 2 family)
VVIVATNQSTGNALLVFPRAANGALGSPTSYPTGGLGSGGGLGNQGGLFLDERSILFAVNAGSDEISAFRLTGTQLSHLGNVPSGGDQPISLEARGNLLYVLNDGIEPNVHGFRMTDRGTLAPIAGSARRLSGAAVPDAAQVGFSSNGKRLVVTEKATNLLTTYRVRPDGTLGPPIAQPSAGATPFGFAFDHRGTLIVSEAFGGAPDASVLSSYRPAEGAPPLPWTAISPLAATTETAACWVVVTPNGQFVYTTNTGSNTVSGFALGADGSLTLLDANGVTGTTAPGPIDMAVAANGRYLYTLDQQGGAITGFRIRADGSLERIGSWSGLPPAANGLVAR